MDYTGQRWRSTFHRPRARLDRWAIYGWPKDDIAWGLMPSAGEAWDISTGEAADSEPSAEAVYGLRDCLLDYQRTYMALRNFAEATRRGYASDIRLLLRYFNDQPGMSHFRHPHGQEGHEPKGGSGRLGSHLVADHVGVRLACSRPDGSAAPNLCPVIAGEVYSTFVIRTRCHMGLGSGGWRKETGLEASIGTHTKGG